MSHSAEKFFPDYVRPSGPECMIYVNHDEKNQIGAYYLKSFLSYLRHNKKTPVKILIEDMKRSLAEYKQAMRPCNLNKKESGNIKKSFNW